MTKPADEQCRWNSLDGDGLVRISWAPDDSDIATSEIVDNVDATIRASVRKSIARDGVWSRIGEYKCRRSDRWRCGNDVHGFIGRDDDSHDDEIKIRTMAARNDDPDTAHPHFASVRGGGNTWNVMTQRKPGDAYQHTMTAESKMTADAMVTMLRGGMSPGNVMDHFSRATLDERREKEIRETFDKLSDGDLVYCRGLKISRDGHDGKFESWSVVAPNGFTSTIKESNAIDAAIDFASDALVRRIHIWTLKKAWQNDPATCLKETQAANDAEASAILVEMLRC